MSTTAAAFIRELSSSMPERYAGDCLEHARRIAALLDAEGRSPWIGRIRDEQLRGDAPFRAPLVPLRYLGKGSLAWTTHYVACAGDEVFDPVAGEPVAMAQYGETVFGKSVIIEPWSENV